MPIGGENVGTAYVRILADGGDLDDSIADQMDDIDWDKMGRKGSQQWQQGFNEELKSGPSRNKFNDALAEVLTRGKGLSETYFKSKGWQDFRMKLDSEFGAAGRLAADRLEEEMLLGLRVSDLDQRLQGLTKDLVRARRDLDAEMEKAHAEAIKLNDAFNAQVNADNDKAYDLRVKALRDSLDEAYEMNAAFNKRLVEDEVQTRRDRDKQWEIHISRLRAYYDEAYEMNAQFDKASHAALLRQRVDHQHLHPTLRRTILISDRVTEAVARMFGKGSRSEFLNVFGRTVGAFSSLLVLPLKAVSGLLSVGGKIGDMFENGIRPGVVKLTGSFVLLGVGAAGLAVLLGGVVVVVGTLTSALMSLLGAVVAVASALSFALAGGATVALGALVPLVAGIGVATLAIMNMDKETKKAFDGIGKSFKVLGKDAAGNIFNSAAKDAEALKKAVEGLSVITGPVSKALGGLLDEFIDSLSDPALTNFQEFLGRTLPGMVTSLGHIVGNFGEIFMGIWIAITPFVQRFLNWLGQVTQQFADWTNSAAGKNAIRDFMDDAFESAVALGDMLGEVVGLIGDIFGVSRSTGDSIFKSLADNVRQWREELALAAQDGTIQGWFEDAKRTADAIGDAVVAVGEFAAALDTPENRQAVRDLAQLFSDLLVVVQTVAPVFESAFKSMGIAIGPVATGIRETKKAFSNMGETLRTIYNAAIGPALSAFLRAIGFILGGLGDLFGALASIPHAPKWIGQTAEALKGAAARTGELGAAIEKLPESHTTTFNVDANQATVNKVEAQLNNLARTRYAAIIVTHVEGPRPGAGSDTGSGDGGRNAVTTVTGTPDYTTTGGKPTTGQGGNSRTVNANGWTIVTPSTDPEAVAAETFNRLAAAGY